MLTHLLRIYFIPYTAQPVKKLDKINKPARDTYNIRGRGKQVEDNDCETQAGGQGTRDTGRGQRMQGTG